MLLKDKQHIITVAQFIIWWIANSLYAVDAQKLLRTFDSAPLLVIDLAFFQIIVGMGMALFVSIWRNNMDEKLKENPIPEARKGFRSLSAISIIIGVLHISATILTNFSYRAIGSTTTLVWKLTEPCAAVVLKQLILNEPTNAVSLLGVLVVVAGVLTYSVNATTMLTVSPIILANILFPTRNVVVKLDQKRQNKQVPTEQRYFMLLFSSLPLSVCVLAVKLFFERPVLDAFPFLLRNALLFNAYQFASIALLEKLDALTHSVANTLKRFMGILLSALLLREHLSERHVLGLFLTAIGFPIYVRGSKLSSARPLRKSALVIVLVLTPLMLWTTSSMVGLGSSDIFAATSLLSARPLSAVDTRSQEEAQRAYIDSLKDVGSEFIILAPKYVSKQKDRYELDKDDIFSYRGDNVGNFVWEHAAVDLIPDFSSSILCNDTRQECFKNFSTKESPKRGFYYWPTANIFDEKVDRKFAFFLNWAKAGHKMLIIGAGIQADFGELDKDIKDPEEQRKVAVENFQHTHHAKNLLSVMENYSQPILMRGDVTLQTAQRVGYNHGISAGCPTLFLNEDIYLGQTMEARYAKLKNRIGDKSLKIGINIQTTPALFDFFMGIHEEYPNSIIFAQGSNDAMSLERAKIDKSRVRMYSDIEEWKDGIREMDVVFGARIHGNMIALGVSVPIFVIAPDYRVLELVQRMKIPHMTVNDERLAGEVADFDVAEVVYNARINGGEFDHNRCEIAKIYRTVFGRYGFGVSSFVRQISEIC